MNLYDLEHQVVTDATAKTSFRIKKDKKRKRRSATKPPYTRTWPWQTAVLGIVCLVLFPILCLIYLAFTPQDNIWPHLFRTVLPGVLQETVLLMAGVGIMVLLIGTVTAWLITMYHFPGRHIFDWLLLLPLAMPTYIIAFSYAELLDYTGPVQTALRWIMGWQSAQDYWFPEVRSLEGAIFVMGFVLYPYVYLNARASFLQQSICVLEVGRTLGRTQFGVFHSIALPLARPALVAGLTLAMMECLNDIGAVEYFGVNTLARSVSATWLQKDSLASAAQIATVMLIVVIFLFTLERKARRGQQYHHTTGHYRVIAEEKLSGYKGWIAAALCFTPVFLGFLLPFIVLLKFSFLYYEDALSSQFLSAVQNSLLLSGLAALVAVAFALILCYARRVAPTAFIKPAFRIAALGYAIPGTVLAVGLLIPLAGFDNWLDRALRSTFGLSSGLLLSGTLFALVLAYTIRFLSVSNSTLEAGLKQISVNLDAASRALGETSLGTLRRVHLPMLRPALATAGLLVFVDSMKELPATLLLRPFNFETLATHVYSFASIAQFGEAAFAALTIVLFGLIPVILLSRTIAKGRISTPSSSS